MIRLSEAAQIIGKSEDRLAKLCKWGRIPGAVKRNDEYPRTWYLPADFKITPHSRRPRRY